MKRFAWVKGLALMAVMAVTLTGCFSKGGPDKAPDVVVKEAMASMENVKTMNMLVDSDVNLKAIDKVKTGFDKFHFAGSFDIGFDFNDAATPKISVKVDGKGAQDLDKEDSGAGELRLLGNNLYAALTAISDFKGTIPTAMVQPYLGKWWSIVLPADSTKSLELFTKDVTTLTPEEKTLKDLYTGQNLFKNAKYVDAEDVDKVATYAYTADVDKEELKKMVIELSKTDGTTMTAEQLKKMDDSFKRITLTAKLYVAQKEMNMKKIAMTLNIKDMEGADLSSSFSFTYSNVGGTVAIEAAKDATAVDLGAILGGMGLAPAADPGLTQPEPAK